MKRFTPDNCTEAAALEITKRIAILNRQIEASDNRDETERLFSRRDVAEAEWTRWQDAMKLRGKLESEENP